MREVGGLSSAQKGDKVSDHASLGTALPSEMSRVRDELIPMYESIGAPGIFALTMMRQELDTAATALAEGDVVQMIRSYEGSCLW